jgi:hypothetical protein
MEISIDFFIVLEAILGHNYNFEIWPNLVLSVNFGRNGFIKSTPGSTTRSRVTSEGTWNSWGSDASSKWWVQSFLTIIEKWRLSKKLKEMPH